MTQKQEKRVNPVLAIGLIATTAVASIAGSAIYLHKKSSEYATLEAQMPESGIAEFFTLLKEKNYDSIYATAQKIQSSMMSEDAYVQKLENTFKDIDTGAVKYTAVDDGDGDENTASYSLTYQDQSIGTMKLLKDSDNTWIASVVFEGNKTYTVEIPTGLTLDINGMPVSSEYLTATGTAASNFSGMYDESSVPLVDVYVVDNAEPDSVFTVDSDSSYSSITDVVTDTVYLGKTGDGSLNQTLIDDAQILAEYTAADASIYDVQAISVTNSDWYDRISSMQNLWFSDHTTSSFSNQQVLNLIQQSDNTAIANVVFDYYAANASADRTWHCGYQMTMINTDGTWRIAGMGINDNMNPGYNGKETD